jgi:predicted dinucleotide-binding enzyme
MNTKIGIIGSGQVAKTLAAGFKKHGYDVKIGSRKADALAAFGKEQGIATGTFADAAAHGELVVLAVKGTGALEALKLAGAANLAGKPVIDTTNPIAEEPPQNGVIRFFTGPNDSLMERLQAAFPAAKLVKCFSCVGNAFMIDPKFPGGPPSMFICGNDATAKSKVTELLLKVGWSVEDMGMVESARAIEPLCTLWCIPGMRGGGWAHAFKLLKM